MHIFECVYFSGVSIVYLKERNVYQNQNWNRGSKIERRRSFSMDAFLITLLLAILLSAGGTIISLRLFAHRSERVSRPRSERRVYTTDTNISIEDSETARYGRRALATLVILSTLIYSAFHALVFH